MTELTRRRVLAGAAAQRRDRAHATRHRFTGFRRSTTGWQASSWVLSLQGWRPRDNGSHRRSGHVPLPDKFVQNHSKAEVEQALAAAYQPTATVTIPFTPIVINTGPKLRAHRYRVTVRDARQTKGRGSDTFRQILPPESIRNQSTPS
jgi:hypothetical protein